MELGHRFSKCWFIGVSLAAVVIFSYAGTAAVSRFGPTYPALMAEQATRESHSPLRPVDLPTAYTMLLSVVVGLTFSGSARQALELTALGSIPDIEEPDYPSNLVVTKAALSPAAEAYRALYTNLNTDAAAQPLQTLIVTSSFQLEDKSVAAANLAAVIAQSGKRVILVDADLRHPTQHRIFELENQVGLVDALRQDALLSNVLQSVPVENLRVLPSGPPTEDPSELLDSRQMQQVIELLRQDANVVIIDTPPATALPDAKMLAARLGGTLLVIESTETPRDRAQSSKQVLDKFGTHLPGAAPDHLPASSVDHCYYRYYSEHGSSSTPVASGLPAHPFDQTDLRPGQAAPAAVEDTGGQLDTRRFSEPPDLKLLRARLNWAIRRVRARSAIGALLLTAVALIIVAIVSVSSLSKQQQEMIGSAATRAVLASQTASINQTATAVAKERDQARRLTEAAHTQTAVANAAAADATATQQAMLVAAQRTPGQVECDIDIDILQSPTRVQSVTAAIADVELAWRVRNLATSPNCKWGLAGQETRLLRAVEVGGAMEAQVPVQLTWIQGDDYELVIKVPLTVGQHNLVWRLIPPSGQSPRGPDLLASVVVVTPTFVPPPTARPAPTDCPLEMYLCNCRQECNERECTRVCDVCSRPKCD